MLDQPHIAVDTDTAPRARKIVRGPRLRPIHVTRARLIDEHESLCRMIERRNAGLIAAGLPEIEIPEAVFDEVGSPQSVQVWRPRTVWHDTHPDDRYLCTDAQLAEPTGEEDRIKVLNRLAPAPAGSERAALVGFATEAQEKADTEYAKKRKANADKLARRAKHAGHKVASDLVAVDPTEAKKAAANAKKFSDEARELKQMMRDRFEYGPYYKGGKIAGEVVPEMHEFLGTDTKNLRTRIGSPSLARVATLSPRKGRIRAGYDKEALFDSPTKLFALDAPYVELNKRFIGCIVVELDSVLRPEEFRQRLLEILGPKCMPNLIVGRISPDGFLVRPHLIWLLKKPVWNDPVREIVHPVTGEITKVGNERCKPAPIRKHYVVQRCLTQLLLPLGADPAMTNIWKPKNALSFFWSTLITNDDNFFGLTDFEQNIVGWPAKVDEHAMAETAAKMRAEAKGVSGMASNLIWRVVGHIIEPMARDRLRDGDPDFIAAGKAGVDALTAWFDRQVRPMAREALLLAAQKAAAAEAEKAAAEESEEKKAETLEDVISEIDEKTSDALGVVLERRCRFAARWCLGKISKRKRKGYRGRDRDVPFEVENPTPKERQQKASERTAEGRRAKSAWALAKEVYTSMVGDRVRRADFMKDIGTVRRATGYRRWDQAMELLGLVEVEKGVWGKPAVVEPSVSLGATKIKSTTPHGQTDQPSLPSDQAGTPISTPAASLRPGHPVRTVDPPRLDAADIPAEPGADDPPWIIHAHPKVDVRQYAVSRVPEPEPA